MLSILYISFYLPEDSIEATLLLSKMPPAWDFVKSIEAFWPVSRNSCLLSNLFIGDLETLPAIDLRSGSKLVRSF